MRLLGKLYLVTSLVFLSACSVGAGNGRGNDANLQDSKFLTVMPMYWEAEQQISYEPEQDINPALLLRDINVEPGEVLILNRDSCHDGALRGWGTRCVAFTIGQSAFVALSHRTIIAENRAGTVD